MFKLTQLSIEKYVIFFQNALFYLISMALIFMLAGALLLVHQTPTRPAMFFLGFTLFYIFSEIFRAVSYYSDTKIDFFFYGCRFLYVLSLTLLIYYCGSLERVQSSSGSLSQLQ